MRNQAVRLLINGSIFLILLIIMLTLLSDMFMPNHDGRYNVRAFTELEDNDIDVLFIGASQTECAVIPSVLYEQKGITSFNYTGSWQNGITRRLFLQNALRTQAPKVVFIDTSFLWEMMETDLPYKYEIVYTRDIPWSKAKLEYLRAWFGSNNEGLFAYAFPIFTFHENWKNLNMINFNFRATSGNPDAETYMSGETGSRTKGFYFSTGISKVPICTEYYDTPIEFDPDTVALLREMIELCLKNGARPVLALWPRPYVNTACIEYASNIANQYGIQFLPFSMPELATEIDLNGSKDFRNSSHLNLYGAEKATAYLSDIIADEYALADHRGEIGYEDWDQWLAECKRLMPQT